jgi:hypothetical protein
MCCDDLNAEFILKKATFLNEKKRTHNQQLLAAITKIMRK